MDVTRSEEWRSLPPGDYEVSDAGRVRRATPAHGATVGTILKPTAASNGYASFKVRAQDGRRRTAFVHHVVAQLFIGPRPDGAHINHIDGNKLNNTASNLEYVSRLENARHASAAGLLATGERHRSRTHPESLERGAAHWTQRRPDLLAQSKTAKLTPDAVRRLRARRADGAEYQDIAREFGISASAAFDAANGNTWRSVR